MKARITTGIKKGQIVEGKTVEEIEDKVNEMEWITFNEEGISYESGEMPEWEWEIIEE